MNMGCGLIKEENDYYMYIRPNKDYKGINWGNVSKKFKQEFFSLWSFGYRMAETEDELKLAGVSIIEALDKIGYLVNSGKIPYNCTLREAYDILINQK